ncbi:hypothetical protein [Brevibacillus invocatus]|nr:hypothetical protein [Brevibacillus invocatus]
MDMANCTAKLQLVFLVVLLEALVWGQSLVTSLSWVAWSRF